MKTWVHRDAKGQVVAVIATDDAEQGELSLTLDGATEARAADSAGFDDPRDLDRLQTLLSTLQAKAG